MKNKLNVIQINGIKGLIFVVGAVICLIAGFVAFPGLIMKLGWNYLAGYFELLPKINMLQGVLLWGIVVVSYFTFKKRGFFVEFKSAHELSGEELNDVMSRIRAERRTDIITKSIMRAKELEAQAQSRLDSFEKTSEEHTDHPTAADASENVENENADNFLS